MRRFISTSVIVGSLALALGLGTATDALANHWTDAPFPTGQTVLDIARDTAGNVWATTLLEDGSFGHVLVLWKGAAIWEDACQGLDWDLADWRDGLISVGDKLFLVTTDGQCFARSATDYMWHLVDSSLRFSPFTAWDGSLWSGSDYLGVFRMDPATEQSETVNNGLLVVMDNPDAARAYQNPRGNDDYLYVGCTVSPPMAQEMIATPAESRASTGVASEEATGQMQEATQVAAVSTGVSVYRIARGSSTWEDTGLNATPLESELDYLGSGADTPDWGVWHVVAMDGYVFCQVMAPVGGFPVRCFLYDERAGTWTLVEMPEVSESGWYYLASGEPCFARDSEFYFPTGFTSDGVVCDVLDPASVTWRRNVTVQGIPWQPLIYTAQMVGDELLVSSEGTKVSFVEAVPLPTQISKDPGVIGTNFGLALLFALVFGFTSTLFNNTLKANNERIVKTFSPLSRGAKAAATGAAPLLARFGNWVKAFTFRSAAIRGIASRLPHVSRRWLQLAAIVLIAALIYSFLDPTFGFSGHGANIFFSLMISVAIVTCAYEGIQALTSSRGYRIPAGLKLFPAAIGIAILCVILSRASGFTPGYLYGFIGGLAFLGGGEPDDRKRGPMVLVGALCLFVVSLVAWFLTIPVADAAASGSGWAALVQSICAATFVAGLEGLLFGLVPLAFMDGGNLFRWNKVVWAVLFGIAIFLFWHVLLNKNSKYGAAFAQTNTKVLLVLLAFWTVVTVGLYLIFRKPKVQEAQGVAGGWPPPGEWSQPTQTSQGAWSQPAQVPPVPQTPQVPQTPYPPVPPPPPPPSVPPPPPPPHLW